MPKHLIISPALEKFERIDYRSLKDFQGKLKTLSDKNSERLRAVLFGAEGVPAQGLIAPICIWEDKDGVTLVIDGHQRLHIFLQHDVRPYEIPCYRIIAKNRKEAKEKFLALNSQYGQITEDGWAEFIVDIDAAFLLNATTFDSFALPALDMPTPYDDDASPTFAGAPADWQGTSADSDNEGIDPDALEDSDDDADPAEIKRLIDKYIEPPFSVINGRSPRWLERKRKWNNLGIASHVSREHIDGVLPVFDPKKYGKTFKVGASVFDPALAELLYRWFCPAGGHILDPFAGGSVRGIVAACLGYGYTGIDIREEQIIANREQARLIVNAAMPAPEWLCGDSREVLPTLTERPEYDMFFTCPPYGSLEVYSDLEGDISNKPYDTFIEQYAEIIANCAPLLRARAFAAIVVSDFRKKGGEYNPFVADTIRAFDAAGFGYWNTAPYLRPLASAPLRVGNTFDAGQKLVRVHEEVLIFRKR